MKPIYTIFALLSCIFFPYWANSQGFTFIENKGQWNDTIFYKANLPEGALFITKNGPVYAFYNAKQLVDIHENFKSNNLDNKDERISMHAYKLKFINPNPKSHFEHQKQIDYYENFFIGNDSSKWASNVHHFKQINQKNVFNNIDLSYYEVDNNLKYDFIVKKNGRVSDIQLKADGADFSTNEKGQLVIKTSVNTVIEDAPFAYQIINGDTLKIACQYKLSNDILSFEIGEYFPKHTLIIDPSLVFATYSGGNQSAFWAYCATYDSDNNTIIAAYVKGVGWPYNVGAYDTSYNGLHDVGVMKLDPTGSTRIFATYLGGSTNQEQPYSISCSEGNTIYLIGNTQSTDFPVQIGVIQAFPSDSGDIFISRIKANGTQIRSTYLGGNRNDGYKLYPIYTLTSGPGNYLAAQNQSPSNLKYNKFDHTLWFVSSTYSSNFPTTTNAMQTVNQNTGAFIAQVDTNLNQLLYSSYFNSNDSTFFHDIEISKTNALYLCGNTKATNMATAGTFNPNYIGGPLDGFVMKFNPNTKTIDACTYLGTTAKDNALKLVEAPLSRYIYVNGQSLGNYSVPQNGYGYGTNNFNYIQILDSTFSTNLGQENLEETFLIPQISLQEPVQH